METSESARYVCLGLSVRYKLIRSRSSGTPHRLMEDDVYEGWFIPAGTTVIDNPWYVARFCELISDVRLRIEQVGAP